MIKILDKKVKNQSDSTLKIQANIHNRFDIEVIDSRNNQLKQAAVGFNTICNQLWDRIFTPADYFNYIHYGSGSGTPASTDTNLFNFIGSQAVNTNTLKQNIDWQNGIYSIQFYIQLTAGTAVGKTITEVGIGYDASSSTLCTHAMIQDLDGNPISITKTDTDVINIYATVFLHFNPNGFDNSSIRLNMGEESQYGHNFFMWLCGRYSGNCIPNIVYYIHGNTSVYENVTYGDQAPMRGTYSETSVISKNYDKANKQITLTAGRLEASNGNLNGITLIDIGQSWDNRQSYHYTHLFLRPGGNWFPESTITNEFVGIGDGNTKDFSLIYPFAHDVTVYVDGQVAAIENIDYAPNSTNWYYFMEGLHPQSTPDNHILQPITCCRSYFYGTSIFYNPMWKIGIKTLTKFSYFTISVSDDLNTWTDISSLITSHTIPDNYIHSKYWKITSTSLNNSSSEISTIAPPSSFNGKVLHLAEAPPEGAIITADYKCDCIAKNENNVLDMTVQIQLGEYIEET